MATSVDKPATVPIAGVDVPPPVILPASRPARIESLDVFRGLTIAAMIVVNDPGTWSAMYWPLAHADELMSGHGAEWYPGKAWVAANGWTPTDLVFPFFLFIAGVSMVFSLAARRARGDSRLKLLGHALQRSVVILLIGWFIHLQPYFHFSRMRLPGVLPRIAVVYFFAAVITLYTVRRGRIVWIAGLLAGYYLALRFVHVPGTDCDPSGWMTQHCSLAGWLDRKLMSGHLYRTDFDPEGLLSTFPAIATMLLGTLAGSYLRGIDPLSRKIRGLALAGVVGVAAGYAWHPFFPIYKPLWTSSYVLFTAGAACLLMALCSWLIDVRGWRGWDRPFLWLGSNALLMYSLSALMAKEGSILQLKEGEKTIRAQAWVYNHWFAPFGQPMNTSLAYAACFLTLWVLVAWWFYRRRIFVKV